MARDKNAAGTSRRRSAGHEESSEPQPHSSIAFTKEGQDLIAGMGRRPFLYEVEFRPVNTDHLPHFKEEFEAEIERRGWQELVARAPAVNKTLVREFYGNLPDARPSGEVFLRGRWIDFSEEAIANYFQLPFRGWDCLYELEKRTPEQVDEVTRVIARPGATWYMGVAANRATWIRRGLLTDEARNWLRFVDNRLHPNSATGETTWRRAAIVYAIMAGKPINAARIISLFLQGNKKNCGLPGMITGIARQGRVPTKNNDDTAVPAEELQPENFVNVVKGAKRQRIDGASGSGVAPEEEAERAGAPSNPSPPATNQSELADIRERLERMELFQSYMGAQLGVIAQHLNCPHQTFEEYRTPSFPPESE